MPRTYGEKFLRELMDNPNTDDNLGIAMAKVCVKANLPITYVAKALNVSKLTVFHWFRGKTISEKHRTAVSGFIALVERDIVTGDKGIPARTMLAAKVYIQDMIGREI